MICGKLGVVARDGTSMTLGLSGGFSLSKFSCIPLGFSGRLHVLSPLLDEATARTWVMTMEIVLKE